MDAIYTEYATEVRAFTGGDCTCLLEDCFVVNRSVCETCMVPRVILYMRSRLCFHHVGGACPIVCVGHASGVKTVHHVAHKPSWPGNDFCKKKNWMEVCCYCCCWKTDSVWCLPTVTQLNN